MTTSTSAAHAEELTADVLRAWAAARTRVYRFGQPTPINAMPHPQGGLFRVKREDRHPIRAYKWRGAGNRIALEAERGATHVVAASAGNHAQGVARAAAALTLRATIVLPLCAAQSKVEGVCRHAGPALRLIHHGSDFDQAAVYAAHLANAERAALIAPFDDLEVIAGQATIADELVPHLAPGDTVYVPIGGGGLAAGIATVLKSRLPTVRVLGVEAQGQASMQAALEAGGPVDLETVDPFCDGTAVRRVGRLTHALCAAHLDDLVIVTSEEVRAAMLHARATLGVTPEPSGALTIAAVLRENNPAHIHQAVAVLSGTNTGQV